MLPVNTNMERSDARVMVMDRVLNVLRYSDVLAVLWEDRMIRCAQVLQLCDSAGTRASFLANDKRVTWSRVWYLVVLADWLERNGIER